MVGDKVIGVGDWLGNEVGDIDGIDIVGYPVVSDKKHFLLSFVSFIMIMFRYN